MACPLDFIKRKLILQQLVLFFELLNLFSELNDLLLRLFKDFVSRLRHQQLLLELLLLLDHFQSALFMLVRTKHLVHVLLEA